MNYSLIKAIFMAIGGMIGGGIFLLNGFNVYKLGFKSIYSWLIGAIIALVFSFSFIILNLRYHGTSGSLDFSDKLIQNVNLKSIIILFIIIAYVIITSVYTLSSGEYIAKYVNSQKVKTIGIILLIICLFLNYFSKQLFSKIIIGLVGFKLIILFLIIIFGIIMPSKRNLTSQELPIDQNNIFNKSILFIILFYSISCFLSYEGYEFIANNSKKLVNKQFSIPIAYIASIFTVGILYMGLSFVTYKHTFGMLNKQNYFSSLLILINQYGLKFIGPLLVLIIVLIANVSAINATYFAVDTFIKKLSNTINNKFLRLLSREISIPFFKEKRSLYLYIFTILIICFLFLPNLLLTNLSSLLFILFFGYISYLGFIQTRKDEKNKRNIYVFNKNIPYKICYSIQFLSMIISLVSLIILGKSIIKNKY